MGVLSKIKSIRQRILLALLVAALVPSFIVGVAGYLKAYDNIWQDKITDVGFVADERKKELVGFLTAIHTRGGQFMDINLVRCTQLFTTEDEIKACLQSALSIYVVREGAVGARIHLAGPSEPVRVGGQFENPGATAAKKPGQLADFQNVDGPATKIMRVEIADVLSGSELSIYYPTSVLAGIFLPPYILGTSGETFLVDNDGFFVTKARYNSAQGTGVPISAKPMELCLQKNDSELLELDYRAEKIIHGFRYVEEIGGGCIMAHFDQAEAFAPLEAMSWAMAVGAAILASLAAVAAHYMSARIAGPVAALQATTLEIIGGNQDAIADEAGEDEIAELARSFNIMNRAAREYEQDLEAKVAERTIELELVNEGLQVAIEERREAEARARKLALYDDLTELPNRRLLTERLESAIAGLGRSDHRCALLFLDLDDFKVVNDTLGHKIGDAMLVKAAKRMRFCIRETDTAARLGGDEFVILLRNLDENDDEANIEAEFVAEKVMDALGRPYNLQGHSYNCSASIGVFVFSNCELSADTVFQSADAAMYQAKNDGKNKVSVYTEL